MLGKLEAGLAAITVTSLKEGLELPVATLATIHDATTQAAAWAFNTFNKADDSIRAMYYAGANICISGGLCRRVGNTIDGNWVNVRHKVSDLPELFQADRDKISSFVTAENLQRALKLIVATKVSWWLCAHPTGQERVQHYIREILLSIFGSNIGKEHIEMVKTIGNWASTLHILIEADVSGVKAVSAALHSGTSIISIPDDLKPQFKSAPAGTRRLHVAYEATKLLIASPLAKICPDLNDVAIISSARARIMEQPARFHIMASYITGNIRADYDDKQFENVLGRLGTFVRLQYGKSTLVNSPHLTWQKLQSYKDYSPEWEMVLKAYRTRVATAAQAGTDAKVAIEEQAAMDVQAAFTGFITGSSAEVLDAVKAAFAVGETVHGKEIGPRSKSSTVAAAELIEMS